MWGTAEVIAAMQTPPRQKQSTSPKYPHYFKPTPEASHLDIYAILRMWDVSCPATQHAIKKLMCAGQRGAKDRKYDLTEARDAVQRAIDLDDEFGGKEWDASQS